MASAMIRSTISLIAIICLIAMILFVVAISLYGDLSTHTEIGVERLPTDNHEATQVNADVFRVVSDTATQFGLRSEGTSNPQSSVTQFYIGRFYAVKIWASGYGLALPASRFELCVGHINDFLVERLRRDQPRDSGFEMQESFAGVMGKLRWGQTRKASLGSDPVFGLQV